MVEQRLVDYNRAQVVLWLAQAAQITQGHKKETDAIYDRMMKVLNEWPTNRSSTLEPSMPFERIDNHYDLMQQDIAARRVDPVE